MSNEWTTTPQASRHFFLVCLGCVWPSKHSNVVAMYHCQNKGALRGPYTPSTPQKIITAWLGGCRPSIQRIGAERKASCGALGGHFRRLRPWLWRLWRLWCQLCVVKAWSELKPLWSNGTPAYWVSLESSWSCENNSHIVLRPKCRNNGERENRLSTSYLELLIALDFRLF